MSQPKHPPKLAKTIEKVQELINEAHILDLAPGRLLGIETQLAGYYTYLITESANYSLQMNSAYWHRKIAYSRQYNIARAIKNGGDSEKEANLHIKEEIDAELETVWKHEHLKAFCKGIEKVLHSITHRLNQAKIDQVNQGKPNGHS